MFRANGVTIRTEISGYRFAVKANDRVANVLRADDAGVFSESLKVLHDLHIRTRKVVAVVFHADGYGAVYVHFFEFVYTLLGELYFHLFFIFSVNTSGTSLIFCFCILKISLIKFYHE